MDIPSIVWHNDFMRAVKLKAFLTPTRELRLYIPKEVPEGPVEVLVLSEQARPKTTIQEVIKSLRPDRATIDRQTLDARIQTERDSWE